MDNPIHLLKSLDKSLMIVVVPHAGVRRRKTTIPCVDVLAGVNSSLEPSFETLERIVEYGAVTHQSASKHDILLAGDVRHVLRGAWAVLDELCLHTDADDNPTDIHVHERQATETIMLEL